MSGDSKDRDDSTSLPLSGLRVVELARLLPGPWAGSLLGDYGANVIKVEEPGRGDYSRHVTPRYRSDSVYFTTVNRNKRSITLDLKDADANQVLERLVASADVLIESFRPGVADRLGCGYDDFAQINPRLIYCSITGFGQTGPYRSAAGHDLNIAGLSGLLRPEPSRLPVPDGLQMADFAAASNAIHGILLALLQRHTSGRGQHLDIGMLDSLLPWNAITGTSAFAEVAGFSGEPKIEVFGGNPRYSVYECQDGRYVSVSLLERPFWEKLAHLLGQPHLINDRETDADRLSSHGELSATYREELSAAFLTRDRDSWVSNLVNEGIPCWPVYEPSEVLRDPHVVARGMVQWIDDAVEGSVPQWGAPIKSTGMRTQLRPAPQLGEHTDQILAELGYSERERAHLGLS